ncbi:hypothetical protein MN116_001028 [Schistosoma mekongi]|uniref:Uncharacterized protein n=1 Tax=Schistosoma mekongi TaxID=38744 RepID=A0AAE1ZLW2_SCHME|nr:hypothetical protein MN116_001028 [Schistosoma mekongi]
MLFNKQKHNIFYVEIVIILLTGIGGLFALVSMCVRSSWISQRFFEQVHIHTNRNNLTKCETSCWLAIIGTICSITSSFIGAMRISYCNVKKSKRCKKAQFINLIVGFISLLSSVSVWADFLCHLPHELGTTYHFKKFTDHHNKQPVDHNRGFISQSNINRTRIPTVPTTIHLLRNYSSTYWIKSKKNLFYSKQIYFNGNYLFGWAYWFCVVSVVFLFVSNLIYLMRKDCENQHTVDIV